MKPLLSKQGVVVIKEGLREGRSEVFLGPCKGRRDESAMRSVNCFNYIFKEAKYTAVPLEPFKLKGYHPYACFVLTPNKHRLIEDGLDLGNKLFLDEHYYLRYAQKHSATTCPGELINTGKSKPLNAGIDK